MGLAFSFCVPRNIVGDIVTACAGEAAERQANIRRSRVQRVLAKARCMIGLIVECRPFQCELIRNVPVKLTAE